MGGIRFGTVVGAPIVADASAFVLALLFSTAVLIDLQRLEGGSTEAMWIIVALSGIAVVACVFVHELSHVVVAVRRGLHVRLIRLFIFGGYSVIDGVPTPSTEVLVSLAGPAVSAVVGGAFWVASIAVGSATHLGRALFALALANVAIALFNLLPGFPLDGGRLLRGVLAGIGKDRVSATRTVTTIGRFVGFGVMLYGAFVTIQRSPIGLFLLAGGWFLASSAVTAGRREEMSAAFDGMTVADVTRSTPDAVSADMTVSELLDLFAAGPRLRSLPVESDGRVVGVVGQDEIDSIAPSRWPSTRVRSRMSPIGPRDIVHPDDPLDSLLLRPSGLSGRAVVVKDGYVVGIVDGASLAHVLS